MRYLKTQVLNRRAPYDQRLQVDVNNSIIMSSPAGLQLPAGSTAQQPITSKKYGTSTAADINGMIRYNTTTSEFEGYQAGKWRAFKFKEATKIIQQDLGTGDYVKTLFGPLNSYYDPANTSSNTPSTGGFAAGQFGGQNLMVYVENVFQIFNTNYVILQNPARVTSNDMVFTNSTNTIASATTDFLEKRFESGMTITVSGTAHNDGTYVVNTVSQHSMTVTESTYFIADEDLSTEPSYTASVVGSYAAGYYVEFDTAVPLAKAVTVLHGFDH
jgi:hypothetical protein